MYSFLNFLIVLVDVADAIDPMCNSIVELVAHAQKKMTTTVSSAHFLSSGISGTQEVGS